jgi:uncharacterized tellurite resistance protein B-like protein
MLDKTVQKYKAKLRQIQSQTSQLEAQIQGEQKMYLESKQKLEQDIASQVKVDSLEVNMLTYTPDLTKIKDEDIVTLLNQF